MHMHKNQAREHSTHKQTRYSLLFIMHGVLLEGCMEKELTAEFVLYGRPRLHGSLTGSCVVALELEHDTEHKLCLAYQGVFV